MRREPATRALSAGRRPDERLRSLPPPTEKTTVVELVEHMTLVLGKGAIPDARAEARDLVAAICDRPRFWPSLNPHELISEIIADQVLRAAELRRSGAPFAYAVGRAAFRFLSLAVDQRVLIPRQETELLVDLVLGARGPSREDVVADIGTGSGAIAIALATEGTFVRVIGTDVSADSLAVARNNVERYRDRLRAPIALRMGAGLSALRDEAVDVLVSNPPYVAFEEARDLPASVRDWEPATALFSPCHGLAFTREVVDSAPRSLRVGGLLALECDSRRARMVAELVASSRAFTDVQIHHDLAGRDRFVLATRA